MIFGSDMMRRIDLTGAGIVVEYHKDSAAWDSDDNGDEGTKTVKVQHQSDSQKTKGENQRIIHEPREEERLCITYTISEDRTGDENSVKRARLAPLARDRDFSTSKLFRQERLIQKLNRTGQNPLKTSRISRQDLLRCFNE
jgi:hypothetical protein